MFIHAQESDNICLCRGNKNTLCYLLVLVLDERPCEVVTNMVIEGEGCGESTANVEAAGIQMNLPLLSHTWCISIPRCQHPGIPHYKPLSAPSTNHSAFSCPTPNIGGRICRQKESNNDTEVLRKQTLVQLHTEKKEWRLWTSNGCLLADSCSGFVLRCQICNLFLQDEGSVWFVFRR